MPSPAAGVGEAAPDRVPVALALAQGLDRAAAAVAQVQAPARRAVVAAALPHLA